MAQKLVIVESPGKIKTIQKYLGPGYKVKASIGHCYQIEPKDGSIDIENNYTPKYVPAPKKSSVIKELKAEAKKSDVIYIASDPDREGEAIGWHIAHFAIKDQSKIKRIVFNEITKSAVQAAIKNPTVLNENLYNAQQARSVLDMLVGYKVSPVLWRKVCKGTSAGRVQSIGLKLIVERQKEIDAFVPEEYWTIKGLFDTSKKVELSAEYTPANKLKDEDQTKKILADIEKQKSWSIGSVESASKKRSPYPPFTTSTLQQFCSSYMGWDGKKTMRAAQSLYEGFSVNGNDQTGLITYHRTDSLNISKEALGAVRGLLKSQFKPDYLPTKPRFYKTKSKSAQEAHEAIRPAHLEYSLNAVKASIPPDVYKLYEVIYCRFVASQMTEALFDSTKIKINSEDKKHTFSTSGQIQKFDGFLKVWRFGSSKDVELPEVKENESTDLKDTIPEQHFTKPPAAYNSGSLVKMLEEKGIGRPSTYASILDTLLKRAYVVKEGKAFKPTDLGVMVSDFLVKNFKELMDLGFTARIEDQLDDVANHKQVWFVAVDNFYKELKKRLDVSHDMESMKKAEETDILCPTCKKHNLVIRRGKWGEFYGCAGYLEKGKAKCKGTFQISEDGKPVIKVVKYLPNIKCDKCGSKIIIRTAKKSGKEFGGCSGFPKCKRMFSMEGEPMEFKGKRRR